jgi:hypothetical protein
VITAVMQAVNTSAAVLDVTEVAEYVFTSYHQKTLGWPIRDGVLCCSYQVCLECGRKRLFDENFQCKTRASSLMLPSVRLLS